VSIATIAEPASYAEVGSAPAGLNPAQRRALERIQAVRVARAQLAPLPVDEYDAEHHWQQWRRWNGADQ